MVKRFGVYLWAVVLVVVDQVVKLGVVCGMKDKSITIIKGILNFNYCENKGVAFSFGYGHVPVFIIVNVLIIGGLTVYYEKNKSEFKGLISKIFFTMVIAGGISNLLDRVIRGFVVDFIDISELFNFAVFNVADIFIVVGVVGLCFSFIIKEIKTVKKAR